MFRSSLQLSLPNLEKTLSPISSMNLNHQRSDSPVISQKDFKKDLKHEESLLIQETSQIQDEEDIEVSLENAWQILLKDPKSRTEKQNNCVNEIVKELEIFKNYIEIVKKDVIKKISAKLIGFEFQKDQVILSNGINYFIKFSLKYLTNLTKSLINSNVDLDSDWLYFILEGKVNIYESNQANGDQSKAKFIRQYQKGQCINLNYIVFQSPFTNIAISDSHSLIAKLDKKIFRKYLQRIEEETVDDEISFLQSIDIFQQLSSAQLQDLILNMEIQRLSLNETLYCANSKPEEFYIIKSGQIGIFKRKQIANDYQPNKQLFFADKEEKQYNQILNHDNQEENVKTKHLIKLQTTFQDDIPYFQSSLRPLQSKIQELNSFDFFGYEEILSNKKRDHDAKSLQDNTVLYVFRRSYFIKKLLKFKGLETIIMKKRFTNKLENKNQQNLSIQNEQDLKLGLKFIEIHSNHNNYLLQNLSLNDTALSNVTHIFERNQRDLYHFNNVQKQKQSYSFHSSSDQQCCLSPLKTCKPAVTNLNRLANSYNKKVLIEQSYYLKNQLNNQTQDNLQMNGFMMRQQEKIDAYIQKQNQRYNLASLDTPNKSRQEEYSIKSARKLLNQNQANQCDYQKQQNTNNQRNKTKTNEESQAKQNKYSNKHYLQEDYFGKWDSPKINSTSLNEMPMNYLKTEQEYSSTILQQKAKSEQSFSYYEQQKNTNSVLSSTKKVNPYINSKNIFTDPQMSLSQKPLKGEANIKQNKKGTLENLQLISSQNNQNKLKNSFSLNKKQYFKISSLQSISNV
ncbi:hypothetical protein ABPG74_017797 [Tetrahymena malaccensis]